MASPKPKWGSKKFEPIDFPVSDSELSKLLHNFEQEFSISKIPFNDTDNFKKHLCILITIYRTALANKSERPRSNNLIEEFKQIKKLIDEVYNKFDIDNSDRISEVAEQLINLKEAKYHRPNQDSLVYTMCSSAELLVGYISEILEELISNPSGRPEDKTRDMIVEEFARLFENELDYQPTKTREGLFYRCVKHFFGSINFDSPKCKIRAPIIDDYFHIISKAIDTYPLKNSIFSEGFIYPGL